MYDTEKTDRGKEGRKKKRREKGGREREMKAQL
jgi:hypothetical protein